MLSPPCQNMGGIHHPHPPPPGFTPLAFSISTHTIQYRGVDRIWQVGGPLIIFYYDTTRLIAMWYLALGEIFENMIQLLKRVSLNFERILNRKWLVSYRNSDVSSPGKF